MKVDCIADLHGFYPELEGGDLLIVAGDLTARDQPEEYSGFLTWLMNQPYQKKIYIGGNHDNLLLDAIPKKHYSDEKECFEYLCDSETEFEGLKIWGSPWTKTFPGINPKCKAFTVDNEDELIKKFEKIPQDVDILITHSPAFYILDETANGRHVGSMYLYNWFSYVGRPKLHVCGHIHEAYGQKELFRTYTGMVKHVNCSIVNEYYKQVNKPVSVII